MPPSVDIVPEKVEFGRETGIEVARRLKELKSEVPIIALTVVNDPDIKARMQEAGICHIINKPEDPYPIAEVILQEIRKYST